MKLDYFGTVNDNGELRITHRAKFDEDLKKYFTGKHVEITIQKKRKKRSLMQNNFYWGVVIPILYEGWKDMGHDTSKEQIHEFNLKEFNFIEVVNEKTGEVKRMPQSSTVMTTSQFMDFLSSIQRFAAEFLNIQIPDPNEDLKLEL